MKRSLLFVALTVVFSGGCRKTSSDDGPYSGGGNPTPEGAAQAVRGAVNRTVDAVEMHDLRSCADQAHFDASQTFIVRRLMAEGG